MQGFHLAEKTFKVSITAHLLFGSIFINYTFLFLGEKKVTT